MNENKTREEEIFDCFSDPESGSYIEDLDYRKRWSRMLAVVEGVLDANGVLGWGETSPYSCSRYYRTKDGIDGIRVSDHYSTKSDHANVIIDKDVTEEDAMRQAQWAADALLDAIRGWQDGTKDPSEPLGPCFCPRDYVRKAKLAMAAK